jgi:hypothetical protein
LASQLNITLTTSGNPVVVVPLSAALKGLDSGATASTQTGFSAVDQAVRAIFRAGGFYVPSTSTWYPTYVIQSITSS